MNRSISSLTCLVSLYAGSAFSQGYYVYDFDLVLIENQLISQGISSRFDALTVGTSARLRMEISEQTVDFPGLSGENHKYYSVLSVDFTAGNVVDTEGTPGIYPSDQLATTMHVANDSFAGPPDRYLDQFGNFLSFADNDIELALVLINQETSGGALPDFLPNADLPTPEAVMLAPDRTFFFQTTYYPGARIRFDFAGASRSYVPTPSSLSLLGLGALAVSRRRRSPAVA